MLFSKAIIHFAIFGFSSFGVALPPMQDKDTSIVERDAWISAEFSTDNASEGPKHVLSKRISFDPTLGGTIVQNVYAIVTLGYCRLVLRDSENAVGPAPYGSITAGDLLVDTVISRATVLSNNRDAVSLNTVPTSMVALGYVTDAFMTVTLGRGVPSWTVALALLDQTGSFNTNTGQNIVGRFIRQSVSQMLALGLRYAAFEFTRQIYATPPPENPQAVIMTFFVQIFQPTTDD